MTTVAEQHSADMASIVADPSGPAVDAIIGSIPVRVIREPADYEPVPGMEVINIQRENLYLLKSDLGGVPVPNSTLVIDGEKWAVDSVPWKGDVLQVVIYRYLA